MKKKRVQERATEQEKIKARRMQAGQVSFKAAAEKRVRSHVSAHACNHVSCHVRVCLWAARKWAHRKKLRFAHTNRHRRAHKERLCCNHDDKTKSLCACMQGWSAFDVDMSCDRSTNI
jgi:hypothetical protein